MNAQGETFGHFYLHFSPLLATINFYISMASSPMQQLYDYLYQEYGPQGWWPLYWSVGGGVSQEPYHEEDYSFPQTDRQRLEISIGAILTQNTAWKNVVKALTSLQEARLCSVAGIREATLADLAKAIRPAGYFNQKADYLKNWVLFLAEHPFAELSKMPMSEVRKLVLTVKGVGPETADCILLYALGHPTFVIDAYTKRFLIQLGFCDQKSSYEQIRSLFMNALPPNLEKYQEYHALFVKHGKNYYSKKPYALGDPFLSSGLNI